MAASTNHRIRLMANNLIENLDDSRISFSSEDAEFNLINVKNTRRSSYWKPTGNFDITALNNVIYINDGTDKSVNITIAKYLAATLAAEIQTKLNSISTNWTCTYSSTTLKFTIARSSGAAVIRLSQTTNSIWDTIGFLDSIDDSTGPFVAEEIRIHTSEYVTFDFGAQTNCTFFGSVSPSDRIFPILETAEVNKIEASAVNNFVSPEFTLNITSGIEGNYKFFDETYRYWRFTYSDRTNPNGNDWFRISHVYLGDFKTLSQTNVARRFNKTRNDLSSHQTTEAGQKYFRKRRQLWSYQNNSIEQLTMQERIDIEYIWSFVGLVDPFFVSIDPLATHHNTIYETTKFVRFSENPKYVHLLRDRYNVDISFDEVL